MKRVLMSACLLGERVRYDGGTKPSAAAIVARWRAEGRIVPVCPEVAGGLPVPRPPAELRGGDGDAFWEGTAVVSTAHDDVSEAFRAGAEVALRLAREQGVTVAVLKARSPSCSSGQIYDGTFSGKLVEGRGVTAALLERHGIVVFDETQLEAADAALRGDERG